jgi:hypothetical protein
MRQVKEFCVHVPVQTTFKLDLTETKYMYMYIFILINDKQRLYIQMTENSDHDGGTISGASHNKGEVVSLNPC